MKLMQLLDAKKRKSRIYKVLALVISTVINYNNEDNEKEYWQIGEYLLYPIKTDNNSYIVNLTRNKSIMACRFNVVIIKNRLVSCVINYFYDIE